jgi:hypothetical protein
MIILLFIQQRRAPADCFCWDVVGMMMVCVCVQCVCGLFQRAVSQCQSSSSCHLSKTVKPPPRSFPTTINGQGSSVTDEALSCAKKRHFIFRLENKTNSVTLYFQKYRKISVAMKKMKKRRANVLHTHFCA